VILKLKEDKKQVLVDARTVEDNRKLIRKRNFINFVSIIWIFIGWTLIYLGSAKENELQDFINEKIPWADYPLITDWSATYVMTIVGYVVPYFLAILIDLMEWDFAEELLFDDLQKNYYTSMFNIVLFGFLQYIDIL
jgi:hypothetical protein